MKSYPKPIVTQHGPRTALLCALVIVGTTMAMHRAIGAPRPPGPPFPEIGLIFSENWDEPYGLGSDQFVDPTLWAESWSGYCLDRTSPAVVPWTIPMAITNRALVDPTSGAFRFWYQPAFGAGAGPGHVARLLTLASVNSGVAATWLSLVITPDGGTLSLVCGEDPQPCLTAPVAIQGWTLITLCYSPTNSAIFVNDTLVASGPGLSPLPAQLVPYSSLTVGSGPDGLDTAAGQIDELAIFSGKNRFRSLTGHPFGLSYEFDIAGYWNCYKDVAALGAISAEELAAKAAEREARLAARSLLSATTLNTPLDGPDGPDPQPPCGTNDIYDVWITNVTVGYFTNQGWTVSFTIAGGTNGAVYDVFGTPSLSPMTNSTWVPWVWLTNGYACDRITVTNQWPGGGFYILGTPLDSDLDGLTDAWERLIGHTDPYSSDTDGDGVSDAIEVLQGRNPLVGGAVADTGGAIQFDVYTPFN
jgi:hypothetical protein